MSSFKFRKQDWYHFIPAFLIIVYRIAIFSYDALQPGFHNPSLLPVSQEQPGLGDIQSVEAECLEVALRLALHSRIEDPCPGVCSYSGNSQEMRHPRCTRALGEIQYRPVIDGAKTPP